MLKLLSSTSSAIHTHPTISCYIDCHSHIACNCSQYFVQHDVCTAPDVTYLAKAYPAMLKPLNLEPFSGHIKWIDKGLGTNPSHRTAQKGTYPWQIHVIFITTFLLHCSTQKWVQCKLFWNNWHYCQGKLNCSEKQSAKLFFCPPRHLQQQTVWTTIHP